jgi:hypothetical protein
MCDSSDVAPWVNLRFNVDFGDGSSDQGFCRFTHVYDRPARYTATACVSDRIRPHEPGVCQKFTIGAYCELDIAFGPMQFIGGGCYGTAYIAPGSCPSQFVAVSDATQSNELFPIPTTLYANGLPPGFAFKFQGTGNGPDSNIILSGITYSQANASCKMSLHTVAPD